MNRMLVAGLVGAVLGAVAGPALHAHGIGDLVVRTGPALIAPNDDSSAVRIDGESIGGGVGVGNDTQLGLTVAYRVSERFGIELLAATPFSHGVSIEGLGDLDGGFADVKHLPPTLVLQYYPMAPDSRWQPYLGVDINYTVFFDEELTGERKAQGFSGLDLDDSWGLALQAGTDWMINDRLLLNVAVWYLGIDSKATATLNGESPAKVTVDVDIDPWVVMAGLGYRF